MVVLDEKIEEMNEKEKEIEEVVVELDERETQT